MALAYSCPVCRAQFDQWRNFRGKPRLCPKCYSFERTRAIWLYFQKKEILIKCRRFLHIGPEKGLQDRLIQLLNRRYVASDIHMTNVSIQADLTTMCFKSGIFDMIYCSNVLEHIGNDLKAMSELYRMLVSGGLAIVQVPIKGEATYENPEIVTEKDRELHFGQRDHVRYYGRDIKIRLSRSGFSVEEVWMPAALGLSDEEQNKFRVNANELLHFCRK